MSHNIDGAQSWVQGYDSVLRDDRRHRYQRDELVDIIERTTSTPMRSDTVSSRAWKRGRLQGLRDLLVIRSRSAKSV